MSLFSVFTKEGFRKKYEKVPLLFHGTNRGYLNMILSKKGKYESLNDEPVYLTRYPDNAVDYAIRRSKNRREEPILLIVQTRLILHKLSRVFLLHPVVPNLEDSEFDVCNLESFRLEQEVADVVKFCRERFNV